MFFVQNTLHQMSRLGEAAHISTGILDIVLKRQAAIDHNEAVHALRNYGLVH